MKSEAMLVLVLASAGLAVWWVTRHRETMAALAPAPPPLLAGAGAALPYYALPAQTEPTGGIPTSAGFISASDIALVSEAELDEFLASL